MSSSVELVPRVEVERIANREALLETARATAERAVELREHCSTAHEADELRRELHGLVGVFQAKRLTPVECIIEERRVEMRIGQLLGPRRQGARTDLTSSPGEEVGSPSLHDRLLSEFRRMYEYADAVEAAIAEGNITRRDAVLAARTAEALKMAKNAKPDGDKPEGDQWRTVGRHLIYCGDSTDTEFRQRVAEQKPAFAFADPPYNAGVADWDSDFKWAHDYLTGVAPIAAVTPGIASIADFFAQTTMAYQWSVAAWITNGMTRGALGYGNWIYIALFGDGDLYRQAQDHVRVTITNDESNQTGHRGRKPEALLRQLLDLFTEPGDLVVDPFLGSGTTLFAAEATGRTCIGAEIQPDYVAQILARFEEAKRP